MSKEFIISRTAFLRQKYDYIFEFDHLQMQIYSEVRDIATTIVEEQVELLHDFNTASESLDLSEVDEVVAQNFTNLVKDTNSQLWYPIKFGVINAVASLQIHLSEFTSYATLLINLMPSSLISSLANPIFKPCFTELITEYTNMFGNYSNILIDESEESLSNIPTTYLNATVVASNQASIFRELIEKIKAGSEMPSSLLNSYIDEIVSTDELWDIYYNLLIIFQNQQYSFRVNSQNTFLSDLISGYNELSLASYQTGHIFQSTFYTRYSSWMNEIALKAEPFVANCQ